MSGTKKKTGTRAGVNARLKAKKKNKDSSTSPGPRRRSLLAQKNDSGSNPNDHSVELEQSFTSYSSGRRGPELEESYAVYSSGRRRPVSARHRSASASFELVESPSPSDDPSAGGTRRAVGGRRRSVSKKPVKHRSHDEKHKHSRRHRVAGHKSDNRVTDPWDRWKQLNSSRNKESQTRIHDAYRQWLTERTTEQRFAAHLSPKLTASSTDVPLIDGPIPNSWDLHTLHASRIELPPPMGYTHRAPFGYQSLATSWETYQQWCLHRAPDEMLHAGVQVIFSEFFNPVNVCDVARATVLSQFWAHINGAYCRRLPEADPSLPEFVINTACTPRTPMNSSNMDVTVRNCIDVVHLARRTSERDFIQLFFEAEDFHRLKFLHANETQLLTAAMYYWNQPAALSPYSCVLSMSALRADVTRQLLMSMPTLPLDVCTMIVGYVDRSISDRHQPSSLVFDELRCCDADMRHFMLVDAGITPFSLDCLLWETPDSWSRLPTHLPYAYLRDNILYRPVIDTVKFERAKLGRESKHSLLDADYSWPGLTIVYGPSGCGKTLCIQRIAADVAKQHGPQPYMFCHFNRSTALVSGNEANRHVCLECESLADVPATLVDGASTIVYPTDRPYIFTVANQNSPTLVSYDYLV